MPKTTKYIIIKDLALICQEKNSYQFIADRLHEKTGSSSYQKMFNYESLEEAENLIFEQRALNAGILEIEISDDSELESSHIKKLVKNVTSSGAPSEKAAVLAPYIKAAYVNGFKISFPLLNPVNSENEHIKQLNYAAKTDEDLVLTQPPLLYLQQLDNDLRYQLFVDNSFFYLRRQNWRYYEMREPGCVFDLFTALEKKIFDYLNSPNKPKITFQDIIDLHSLLSKNLLGKTGRSGVFRDLPSSFTLSSDTATKEGIKEILFRIREDKNPDGFMIGEVKKFDFVAIFCSEIRYLFVKAFVDRANKVIPSDTTPDYKFNLYQRFKKEALDKAYEEISKTIVIDKQEFEKIINNFISTKNVDDLIQQINHDEFFWDEAKFYFAKFEAEAGKQSNKDEFDFETNASRENALAGIGNKHDIKNYTDSEIDTLASDIYQHIAEKKLTVSILTPSPTLAQEWAQKAINQYNEDIFKATTPQHLIKTIDALAHEIEILHLFHDVNTRTIYLLYNMLSLAVFIKWDMEFNPNRFDAYSQSQRFEQHKQGIARTDYTIAHQAELLKMERQIDKNYETIAASQRPNISYQAPERISGSSGMDYVKMTAPLKEKLENYQADYNNMLDKLISKYEKAPEVSSKLFSPSGTSAGSHISMLKALKQLKETKHILLFFHEMNKEPLSKEVKEDIESIRKLTGYYNDKWLKEIKPSFAPDIS